MIEQLKSMVSQVFYAPVAGKTAITEANNNYNPFENPFVQPNNTIRKNYAVNKPVKGGYFAGYYNGKPNIVGRRLFIEA